jgi:hypothetical protein
MIITNYLGTAAAVSVKRGLGKNLWKINIIHTYLIHGVWQVFTCYTRCVNDCLYVIRMQIWGSNLIPWHGFDPCLQALTSYRLIRACTQAVFSYMGSWSTISRKGAVAVACACYCCCSTYPSVLVTRKPSSMFPELESYCAHPQWIHWYEIPQKQAAGPAGGTSRVRIHDLNAIYCN